MKYAAVVFVAAAFAAAPMVTRAQAPQPDPAPAPAPHPNFTGTWALNSDLSDDPIESAFNVPQERPAPRQTPGGFGGRGGYGGRGGFGGRGGYGGGGYGGRGGAPGDEMSSEQRAIATELISQIKAPASTITISHSDPSFTVTDDREHTRVFQTTGAKDKHQLMSGTVTSTTNWIGRQLVTEYDLGNGRHLDYTYISVPATHQLVVRIRMVNTRGDGAVPAPVLKLVYDAAPPGKRPGM